MLLQSHLLSAVSGENDAVIQEFQCLMLILICCIKVELQCELHKCETVAENDAVIQEFWWLMLNLLCCITAKLKYVLHKCEAEVRTAA